jgi:hypothetical protein
LKTLVDVGEEKIKKDLNIVNIIKSLRDVDLLMRNSLMTPQVKILLQHVNSNIIFLDSSDLHNNLKPEHSEIPENK